MSESLMITSLNNPKVKQIIKLRKRREREKQDLFLIEGYREILRAQVAKKRVHSLFFCKSFFLGENEQSLIDKLQSAGAKVFSCTEKVFRKVSYRDRPDGLIALAFKEHLSLKSFKSQKKGLYVVAVSIEKPGNLGTILRSADASNVNAVIVCDRCTDIHNPNVVRASVGTLFTLPVIEATTEETFSWLKENAIKTVAAAPDAKKNYTQVDMCTSLALIVGTEQVGLSDFWLENADETVSIPMLGVADSLNVAQATTLLLFEAVRQRQ